MRTRRVSPVLEVIGVVVVIGVTGLLFAPAVNAAEGRVVDDKGHPLAEVRVCTMLGNVELACAETNDEGRFGLGTGEIARLRFVAEDFLPRDIELGDLPDPVVMKRAPSLMVRVVEAGSKKPVGGGEIYVVYSTGVRRGPFPFNQAGLRVRRALEPGEVKLVVELKGYEVVTSPDGLRLQEGRETEVLLEVKSIAAPTRP